MRSTLLHTTSDRLLSSSSQRGLVVLQLLHMPHAAAVQLASFLEACRSFHMCHSLLAVSTDTQTIIGDTTISRSEHQQIRMVYRICTVNHHSSNLRRLYITQIRRSMVMPELGLTNLSHMPVILRLIATLVLPSSPSKGLFRANHSRSRFSYRMTWLAPSSEREAPKSTKSDN